METTVRRVRQTVVVQSHRIIAAAIVGYLILLWVYVDVELDDLVRSDSTLPLPSPCIDELDQGVAWIFCRDFDVGTSRASDETESRCSMMDD